MVTTTPATRPTSPTLSERNTLETRAQAQAQAVDPSIPDDSATSESDKGEMDCLILRDGEDKSSTENVAGAMPKSQTALSWQPTSEQIEHCASGDQGAVDHGG